MPPTYDPIIVPMGLKVCAKFSRWSAVSAGPMTAISGFAEVSRNARPLAITYRAMRNA